MRLSPEWKMAFRSLRRNRRRNFTTGSAIAFGAAGLILLGAYIVRTEHYLRVNSIFINHNGHISIWKEKGLDKHLAKPTKYNLTGEEQKKIFEVLAAYPGRIEFTARYLRTVGLIGNGCSTIPYFALGVEPEVERRIRTHPEVLEWVPELARYEKGRGFWGGGPGEKPTETGVVVTGGLARLADKPRVFDEVPGGRELAALDCQAPGATAKIRSDADIQLVGRTFAGDLGALDGEIMGHYSTGLALSEDSGLTAPLALLQKLHDTDAVTYVSVYLRDVSETQALAGELASRLKEKGLPIEIHTYREEAISLFYVGVVGFLLTMAAFFIFLVATVVSLSIVNALTMSVLERTREIGTLRSIGFSPRRVAGIFVRESFVLGALSLLAGVATAYLVTAIVNRSGIRFTPPGIAGTMPFLLVPTPALCAGIAGFLSIIIVIASFKTTVRRTRMSAAKLLVEATG